MSWAAGAAGSRSTRLATRAAADDAVRRVQFSTGPFPSSTPGQLDYTGARTAVLSPLASDWRMRHMKLKRNVMIGEALVTALTALGVAQQIGRASCRER